MASTPSNNTDLRRGSQAVWNGLLSPEDYQGS